MSEWEQRFWSKVSRKASGCWLWTAPLHNTGYGQFKISGRMYLAHRLAYQLLIGAIPTGLQLDHLCRNRGCVNPAHLEPVTIQENLRRGLGTVAAVHASAVSRSTATTCKRGHLFTDENTRRYRGRRHCRTCARLHSRRYRAEARNG